MNPLVQILGELDRNWLEMKAAELGGDPILYVQGYEWIGFARWVDGAFQFFPGTAFSWRFSEVWDLRLFSDTGEWHCWKTGDGIWTARFLRAADLDDSEVRDYVLWGRETSTADGWSEISEANGARIRIPLVARDDLKRHPMRLKAWLCTDYSDNGQAFIADVVFRELHQTEEG